MSYEMDLVVLGPDKDMQFLFDGLLSKAPSLGARVPSHRLDTHPLRDSGCLDADELLESQVRRYAHALVVTNAERSGRTGSPREDIEVRIEQKLCVSGWGDRARAIVVAPGIGRWLLEHLYQERWSPGTLAQATLEALLRRKRIPQSPELYRTLGALLVDEGESDPAWQKIVSTLKDWFGAGPTLATDKHEHAELVFDLFARLEQMSRAGKLDAALDLVFDQVDDMLLLKRFPDVNQILRGVPVERLDAAILVGFLTITGPAREALRDTRPALVARVREELEKRLPDGETARVMMGLE
jgi:hypothetical protein